MNLFWLIYLLGILPFGLAGYWKSESYHTLSENAISGVCIGLAWPFAAALALAQKALK